MNIDVENFEINSAILTVDYFRDNIYVAESFPVDEFKVFCEQNNLLDWNKRILLDEECVTDVEDKISFERYCAEYICEADVKLFIESKYRQS